MFFILSLCRKKYLSKTYQLQLIAQPLSTIHSTKPRNYFGSHFVEVCLSYYDHRNNSKNSEPIAVQKHGIAIGLASTLSYDNCFGLNTIITVSVTIHLIGFVLYNT
jgi:hypothetical protein